MENPTILDSLDRIATEQYGSQEGEPAASVSDVNMKSLESIAHEVYSRVDANIDEAIPRNPDKEAEAKQIGEALGIPTEQVRQDQDALSRLYRRKKFSDGLKGSPILSQQLLDRDFAGIAIDDVQNLGDIERTFAGTVGDLGITATKAAVGLPQMFAGLADLVTDLSPAGLAYGAITGKQLGNVGQTLQSWGVDFKGAQDALDQAYSPAQRLANARVYQADGLLNTLEEAASNPSVAFNTIVESLPQMLAGGALARGGMTIAKALGLKLGEAAPVAFGAAGEGISSAGYQLEQLRGDRPDGESTGKDVFTSTMAGIGTGFLAGIGGRLAERLGVIDPQTLLAGGMPSADALAKLGNRALASRVLLSLGSEGLQEMGQESQEQIWQNIAQDRPMFEGVDTAAALGLLSGAAMGGGAEAMHTVFARDHIRAVQAEQNARIIQSINSLAAASRVLERDPASFEAFVARASEGTPVENVYIDANTLMQTGVADQISELSPAVAEQLDEAVRTGGTIAIPTGEYAAKIAPTEYAQTIFEHLRVGAPDAYSIHEAHEVTEQETQELQRLTRLAARASANEVEFKTSQEKVKQSIIDNMTAAGIPNSRQNEAAATIYSSYYAVRAAQMGTTPEAEYQRAQLRFASDGMGDLNQQAFHGTPHRGIEQHGFKLNKIGSGEGNQAFGYDIYFAGNRDVAEGYRQVLAGDRHVYEQDGKEIDYQSLSQTEKLALDVATGRASIDAMRDAGATEDGLQKIEKAAAKYVGATMSEKSDGQLYRLEVPENDELLDFDKPLSEQPAQVRKAFARALKDKRVAQELSDYKANTRHDPFGDNPTGKEIYGTLASFAGGEKEASEILRDVGVPGLRYLDGNSRGKGDGSHNFVIWDESRLTPDAAQIEALYAQERALSNVPEPVRPIVGKNPLLLAWTVLAQRDMAFQLPITDGTSIPQIAEQQHVGNGIEELSAAELKGAGAEAGWRIWVPSTFILNGKEVHDDVEALIYQRRKEVWVDVSHLDRGNGGRRIYNMVANYAFNTHRVFRGDPAGLSEIAQSRRLENMISSALKFGTTDHLWPHEEQLNARAGVPAIQWKDGDFAGNLESMIRASYEATKNQFPEIDNLRYDGKADQFVDVKTGKVWDEQRFEKLADDARNGTRELRSEGRGSSAGDDAGRVSGQGIRAGDGEGRRPGSPVTAGRTTLERAVFTHTLLRGTREEQSALLARLGEFGSQRLAGVLYQGAGRGPLGTFNTQTLTISLLNGSNASTSLHEGAHFFFENDMRLAGILQQKADQIGYDNLTAGEQQIMRDVSYMLKWSANLEGDLQTQLALWQGIEPEARRSAHERLAESFEHYLFSGKAPSLELQAYFQKIRAWMLNVYKSLKQFLAGHPEAGKLDDGMRRVFDRMLATTEQIELAEQARSLMPLFDDQAKSGMTPEEFAKYQDQGTEAGQSAIQAFQARALRDTQWFHNARDKEIRKLQKQVNALRKETEIDVRREVMTQPVYKAWSFLTRRMTDEDKLAKRTTQALAGVDESRDTLFEAIAKLGGINRSSAVDEWGIDPQDKFDSGAVNKPVVRAKGGCSVEEMAARLAEYGYLPENNQGRFDVRDLEDRFFQQHYGNPQYSTSYEPRDERAGAEVSNPLGVEAGRLDLETIKAMYGEESKEYEVLKARRMVASNGWHPDFIADRFDFDSGDALVQALMSAEDPRNLIAVMTDQRMLEEHGEVSTPEAIEQAADEAIHNDLRSKLVATELDALNKALGKRRVLMSAVKEYAASIVSRVKVRDLDPRSYAQAGARAAKKSAAALAKSDIALSAAEKRNQLLQVELARTAYAAKDDVSKWVRYLRKFQKEGIRKVIDPQYLEQIDALISKYDLRSQSIKQTERTANLKTWVMKRLAEGEIPQIAESLLSKEERASYLAAVQSRDEHGELVYADDAEAIKLLAEAIDRSAKRPYTDLTVEEIGGLVDTVQNIEFLGRRKNKLLTARGQAEYEAVRDEIVADVVSHARNSGKNTPTAADLTGAAKQKLSRLHGRHLKASIMARVLDGGEDNGAVWRFLVQPANEAQNRETAMRAEVVERLDTILRPLLSEHSFSDKALNGKYYRSVGRSFVWQERFAILLNMGNESNLQRLLDGNGWTMEQVLPVVEGFSKAEILSAQAVWDEFERLRPLVAEQEKRINGKEPDWIKPRPLHVRSAEGETVTLVLIPFISGPDSG